MATFNVGGRNVNVPDDLDPSKPAPRDSLRNINPPPAASASYTNPSFRSGASPQATAWQQERSLRNAHLNPPAPEPQVRNLRDAAHVARSTVNDIAARGTGDKAHFGPQPKPEGLGRITQAAKTVGHRTLGAAGFLASAVPTAINARKVANDPQSSRLDVATQVSEDVGKASAAAAGATLGAGVGSAVFPGVGTVVGGALGGAAGYFGGEKLIQGGRALLGLDTDSPVERIDKRNDATALETPSAKDSSTSESLRNPPFIPPDSSAASDTDYSNGGPLRNMVGGNVSRVGNSYSGSNIGENFTINGQAPGSSGGVISAQNLRAADALATRQDDESYNRVAQQQPSLREFRVPSAVHSGNDWTTRQRLRSLEMDAKGIHRTGRERRQAQAAYQNALRDDAAAMMSQPQLHAETNRVNASVANAETRAAADRYSSDNTLRGAFHQAMAEERKAQNATLYESLRYKSEQDAKLQERDAKNMERTREQFAIYGDDNKVDQQATNAFMEYIHSVIPDYSTLPPRERAKYEPKVRALQEIYRNTRDQNSTDMAEALLGHDRPRLNTMPNFKDGTLRQQHLEGLLPGGAGWGGYVVEQPDGSTRTVGKLDENALNSLRRNISTGSW